MWLVDWLAGWLVDWVKLVNFDGVYVGGELAGECLYHTDRDKAAKHYKEALELSPEVLSARLTSPVHTGTPCVYAGTC